MGAKADLDPGGVRWLTPAPLWTGILAGPVAWAMALTASYALTQWVCATRQVAVMHVVIGGALIVTLLGGAFSARALRHTRTDLPDDGGRPRQRARFMAMLGLVTSALFAVVILASDVPPWVLPDACR